MNKTLLLTYISWMIMIMMMMMMQSSLIHPVFMIMLLLFYNINLCMNMMTIKTNPLYSIMFFMMMISGLMIIFMYFSSLVSNEKGLNLIYKSTIITMTLNLTYIITTYNGKINLLLPLSYSEANLNIINTNLNNINFSSITLMYTPPYINITMICMIFLLISLISVIKTCVPKVKTLRKIN